MTLRAFIAWFLSVLVPFDIIVHYHPELANWWLMGPMIAAFWGGMLSQSPTVKETARTVTRTVIHYIEVHVSR